MPASTPTLPCPCPRRPRSGLLQSGAVLRLAVTLGLGLGVSLASAAPCAQALPPAPLQTVLPGLEVLHGFWPSQDPQGPDHHASTVLLWTRGQAVVLDPGPSHRWGQTLHTHLRCQRHLRVVQVINSHAHAEHVLANGALPAPVAASARTRAAMRQRCPDCLAALQRDLGMPEMADTHIRLPQHTLRPGQTLRAGGRRWQVLEMPNAHTESDLVLWSAAERIVLAGPLVDGRSLVLAQGSVQGWLQALERIAALQPQWLIGQHLSAGPAQVAEALQAQRTALCALVRSAWTGLSQGWSEAEALQALPEDGRSPAQQRQRHFNLLRAWREMEALWIAHEPMPAACAVSAP